MNILVTGGAGFIGSHFAKLLLKDKNNFVLVVDKMTYAGNRDNLPEQKPGKFEFSIMDINDVRIEKILEIYNIDIVVNFAAETHVDRSIRDPEAFLKTDVMGLFNLVKYSLKHKIKKFIHISTDEVYGSVDDPFQAHETWPLRPNSPYSASKACADLLLRSYYKTYGLPVIIVRPCNNYGPNQYPEKLIPMAITRLLQKKKVLLHGEGEEIREWIYVEDCCWIINQIMNHGKIGEIYNVGSGDRKSNLEVVGDVIIKIVGSASYFGQDNNFEFIGIFDYTDKIANRPGNDSRYALDTHEMIDLIGYQREMMDFEIGINETIKWYRNNIDFWKDIDIEANIHDKEYLR